MKLKHDFTFVCEACGHIYEADKAPDSIPECCDEYMERVFPDAKCFNINGGGYLHTKYSDSMAVSISQIAEHKGVFPDVKMDSQGRPGFDSVKQQDRYLNACGFTKHPQKIRKIKQLM